MRCINAPCKGGKPAGGGNRRFYGGVFGGGVTVKLTNSLDKISNTGDVSWRVEKRGSTGEKGDVTLGGEFK